MSEAKNNKQRGNKGTVSSGLKEEDTVKVDVGGNAWLHQRFA
jgi:hypothetical protein